MNFLISAGRGFIVPPPVSA